MRLFFLADNKYHMARLSAAKVKPEATGIKNNKVKVAENEEPQPQNKRGYKTKRHEDKREVFVGG